MLALASAAALLLIAACGGGDDDGGGGGSQASPFFFEPQETCEVDLAVTPPDVTVFGADAGDFLADRFSLVSGDFNDDGKDDVLVGAPLADGPGNNRENAGEAYIIFGTAEPAAQIDLSQGAAFTFTGERPGDNLGFTVAAGDVNGDGRDDAIIGARFADAGQTGDAGKAYVVYGHTNIKGALDAAEGAQDVTISGQALGGFLTVALATGDIDGDGVDDILMGAAGSDGPDGKRQDAGGVIAVRGASDLPEAIDLAVDKPFLTVYGASEGDSVPNHLAAGDIDSDGRDEIIIGAPFVNAENREDAGRVYVVPVPRDDGTLDLAADGDWSEMTGSTRKDALGFQVAASDVNGDGVADVIAGARDADGPGDAINNAGEVNVWLGGDSLPSSTDLLKGQSDSIIIGTNPGDSFGFSVATGDLNADGIADILSGAPIADGCNEAQTDAGDAYAVFGRDPLPSAIYLKNRGDLTFLGAEPGDAVGFSVATGDFNGDGKVDAIIGALQADGPGNERQDAGEAYIVLNHGQ